VYPIRRNDAIAITIAPAGDGVASNPNPRPVMIDFANANDEEVFRRLRR